MITLKNFILMAFLVVSRLILLGVQFYQHGFSTEFFIHMVCWIFMTKIVFQNGIQLLAGPFAPQPLIGPILPNPAPAAWNCHLISRLNFWSAMLQNKSYVVKSHCISMIWKMDYRKKKILFTESKRNHSHIKINQNECWRLIWCIFLKNDIYEASHFSSTPVCYPWHFYALSIWIITICFASNFESEWSFGPFCSTTCDCTTFAQSCPCCLKL